MSIKKQRVALLISVKKDLEGICFDIKNQTPEILKGNLLILERRVEEVLKLEGVGFIPSNAKVG